MTVPESTRLSGSIDQMDLDCIEREATPRFLMKLGIELYLAELSPQNTVNLLDIFRADRAQLIVHNWFHKGGITAGICSVGGSRYG